MGLRTCLRALALVAATALSWAPSAARADSLTLNFDFNGRGNGCDGNCSAMIFGGRLTSIPLSKAIGVADITEGKYGFILPTPIWQWPWEDAGTIGGAVSYRFASFGINDTELLDFEAELGVAQRFGNQDQSEIWGALYLRWKWFPWNRYVKTTVGVSTGLHYATGIAPFEVGTSGNDAGSRLLHYLSPEFTLAHPDRPNREFVFRMHHRSGGGGAAWGGFKLFNNADGGSSFATFGYRVRF